LSFQIACKYCGQISQSQLPIVKNDKVEQLVCTNCESTLFYIYGSDHKFTKMVKELDNEEP
jgi:transcription elongation factor Elf1